MWRRAKTSGNGVNVFLSYPNEKRGPSREITASSSSGQHFEGKIFINNSGYFEVVDSIQVNKVITTNCYKCASDPKACTLEILNSKLI